MFDNKYIFPLNICRSQVFLQYAAATLLCKSSRLVHHQNQGLSNLTMALKITMHCYFLPHILRFLAASSTQHLLNTFKTFTPVLL